MDREQRRTSKQKIADPGKRRGGTNDPALQPRWTRMGVHGDEPQGEQGPQHELPEGDPPEHQR